MSFLNIQPANVLAREGEEISERDEASLIEIAIGGMGSEDFFLGEEFLQKRAAVV